jgi:hypothetical protein
VALLFLPPYAFEVPHVGIMFLPNFVKIGQLQKEKIDGYIDNMMGDIESLVPLF